MSRLIAIVHVQEVSDALRTHAPAQDVVKFQTSPQVVAVVTPFCTPFLQKVQSGNRKYTWKVLYGATPLARNGPYTVSCPLIACARPRALS